MSYRSFEEGEQASRAPSPILGFAFYLMAAGLFILGLASLWAFAATHGVRLELGPGLRWSTPVGELMTAFGMVIAWRTSRGRHRRLLTVTTALWATLFVCRRR